MGYYHYHIQKKGKNPFLFLPFASQYPVLAKRYFLSYKTFVCVCYQSNGMGRLHGSTCTKVYKYNSTICSKIILFVSFWYVFANGLQGTACRYPALLAKYYLKFFIIFSYKSICIYLFLPRTPIEENNISSMLGVSCSTCYLCISKV